MLKQRSALDVVKGEFSKLTGVKRHQTTMGVIEPLAADSLQRFKRGRKPFGPRVESRFLACSVLGLQTAHCGAMTFLEGGDTFFNKWPVKLLNPSELRQMDEVAYEKLWETVT